MSIELKYKEIVKRKGYNRITKLVESFIVAGDMIKEFKFLTYTMLVLLIESNSELKYKKLERFNLEKQILILKEIIQSQEKLQISDNVQNIFYDRFKSFHKDNKNFIDDYQIDYESIVSNINYLYSIQMLFEFQFEIILKKVSYSKIFIKTLDEIGDFMILFKDFVKQQKVSKYQKYVGKNLKNLKLGVG